MMTVDEIWNDLEGFTPPDCPQCFHRAVLDEDGYWCEHCSDSETSDVSVDNIPNGAEVARKLTAYRKARGI